MRGELNAAAHPSWVGSGYQCSKIYGVWNFCWSSHCQVNSSGGWFYFLMKNLQCQFFIFYNKYLFPFWLHTWNKWQLVNCWLLVELVVSHSGCTAAPTERSHTRLIRIQWFQQASKFTTIVLVWWRTDLISQGLAKDVAPMQKSGGLGCQESTMI